MVEVVHYRHGDQTRNTKATFATMPSVLCFMIIEVSFYPREMAFLTGF